MEILVLTGRNKFIGQTRKPWVGIDTDIFAKHLNEYGFIVELSEFHNICNNINNISGANIFYTFHQKYEFREYIRDVMYQLNENNRIIPSYEMLKCHENKGYQELLRKSLGIKGLDSIYLSSYREIENYNIKYPIVLKTLDGSNGTGVFLCHNEKELIIKAKNLNKLDFMTKLDLFRRKYLRKTKQYSLYPEYSNKTDYVQYKDYVEPETRFILQEFIPEQKNDYRVLIIHDKYFVIKRYNRENDFRASGAKKFEINFNIDEKLLNTAKYIYSKIDSPYLSLDIIYDTRDDEYKLIEYQALHFGVSALKKVKRYFVFDTEWKTHENNTCLERELAYGLYHYLRDSSNGIL